LPFWTPCLQENNLWTEDDIMNIPFYQIDAFTGHVFAGNPAGVCFLDEWLQDEVLQSIATENNLSETAFLIRKVDHYDLRWFTPTAEIDLCGHATLASGHVIFEFIDRDSTRVEFMSKSGRLSVERQDSMLFLDFPTRKPASCAIPDGLEDTLGCSPEEILSSRDLMVVFDDETFVRNFQPDLDAIGKLESLALIVTAPGRDSDFVSRFFAPGLGIPEDPVTGSAHCSLVPYWAERLGKKELHALQLSQRGGELFCKDRGDRVLIGGKAVTYLSGTISI
jgi:PhzF family phenazine biosynthesis protein